MNLRNLFWRKPKSVSTTDETIDRIALYCAHESGDYRRPLAEVMADAGHDKKKTRETLLRLMGTTAPHEGVVLYFKHSTRPGLGVCVFSNGRALLAREPLPPVEGYHGLSNAPWQSGWIVTHSHDGLGLHAHWREKTAAEWEKL